jgi:hypothetical protein
MKKLIEKLTTVAASLAFAIVPLAMPVAVHAQTADIDGSLCSGANLTVGDTNCDQGDPEGTVNGIIATVINIFSVVVGVVSVIMIIIGGLKYITSGGDSGNVSGAKNTILYAIVGLVVVALAQIIVRFVLTRVGTVTS